MIVRAIQRNVGVSSKKATLCCRLIRNMPVEKALRILENQPQKTARYLSKLLLSAISNAVNNHSMSGKDLYVFSSVANQARTLKRSLPRAKGRADMIRKRFSHLEIYVSDDPEEKRKRNAVLLKPRAHRRPKAEERGSVEVMPKIISKKQSAEV